MEMDRHGNLSMIPNSGTFPSYVTFSLHRIDTFLLLPIAYNFFADFFALVITRRVLNYLSTHTPMSIDRIIIVFIITMAALLVLSVVFLSGVTSIQDHIIRMSSGDVPAPAEGSIESPKNFVQAILFPMYRSYSSLLGEWSINTLYGVFVWSTLMGIFWVALFSAAVVIANLSIQIRGIGPWLERYTKVRSQPFRVLEFMAAIPVAGACVIYHLLF